MRSFLGMCLMAAAAIIPSALAGPMARDSPPVVVTPGPPQNNRVTKDNTLNGTYPTVFLNGTHPKPLITNLPLRLTNNFNGNQLYAYVTGLDPNGAVVFLQPSGQWYYPTASSSSTPQPINGPITLTLGGKGSTSTFTLPTYVSSARIYISEGQLTFSTLKSANGGVALVQPDFNNPSDSSAGKNWGFIELTNTAGGLYANLSFVDFVGLPLGMTMAYSGGSTTVKGVNSGAVSTICSKLKTYAGPDGAPWDQLCMYKSDGTPLRAVAPQKYIAVHSGAFSNYYTNYVNSVWSKYSSSPLTIDSQGSAGKFTCTTSGNNMNCAGASRAFTKPSASEIFGCDGTFGGQGGDNGIVLAATARLCAAFDRTTLLLNGGNVQPSLGSGSYYTTSPTNRYSQLVHSVELDGRGYAFPYDDVNPNAGVDQSGTLSSGQATSLTIAIGGA